MVQWRHRSQENCLFWKKSGRNPETTEMNEPHEVRSTARVPLFVRPRTDAVRKDTRSQASLRKLTSLQVSHRSTSQRSTRSEKTHVVIATVAMPARPALVWRQPKLFGAPWLQRGLPAALSSQCESKWHLNRNSHQKRARYSRRSTSSSVRLTRGQSLWSRKTFKITMASTTRKCFLNVSHMAALSPNSCSNRLASSGGAAVRTRQAFVEAGLRAYRAHASVDQLPASHLLGSIVAGNCLFDIATTDCGQKRQTVRTGTHLKSLLCCKELT